MIPIGIIADIKLSCAVIDLTADGGSSTSIYISWNISSSCGETVDYYQVLYKINGEEGYTIINTTSTQYDITGLNPSTDYDIVVTPINATYTGVSQAITVTTHSTDATAPSTPTGLTASTITKSSFTLSWDASTDDVGVAGYSILKNGDVIDSITGTTYIVNNLFSSTQYSMQVVAYDANDNYSDLSAPLNVTTAAGTDVTAPSVPTGLVCSNIGTTSFTLSWSASTDNIAVTGYKIYKDGIYYVSTSNLSLSITGLAQGASYSMKVSAYDAAGNESAQSTALSVTTEAQPPTVAINTNGFSTSAKSGSVSHGSTTLSYSLTPTDVGINVSCSVVLTKNTIQVDTDTIILRDNTQYNGSFTLADAANYGDNYVVQITV